MSKNENVPSFLQTARAFYGPAFDHTSRKSLARSMAEWAEMDEEEQSFAAAHLAFLNLQAQAGTQKLLVQVRDLLDELAESLTLAVEAALPDDDDEEPVEEELPPELGEPVDAGVSEESVVEDNAGAEGGAA